MSTNAYAPIGGRYAMYKEGGDRVTRWLVSTASSCRRSLTAKSTAKGKVSTRELLRYAEMIASWKPPIDIPSNITELLQDVVAGREACAEFYSSQNMTCEGHQHMIKVLQKILSVLSEARRKRKKEKTNRKQAQSLPAKAEESQQSPEQVLNNLFENLQVEDPCVEAWETAPKKQTTQPANPATKPTLEVDEKEEKMFALFCFLKDMQELRELVRQTWQEYSEKKIAVVTASMVTETALGIMSRANETLVETHPCFAELGGAMEFLELRLDRDCDGMPGFYAVETGVEGQKLDNELTHMLCPEATALVNALQTLFNNAKARAKDRKADGSSTEEQWCYHEKGCPPKEFAFSSFGILLYHLFPDIFRSVEKHKDCKANHEFLHGLIQIGSNNRACLWFISAVQMYSQIHELTQGASTPVYQYWIMNARSMRILSDFHHLQLSRTAQPTTLHLPAIEQLAKSLEKAVAKNIAAMKCGAGGAGDNLLIPDGWQPVNLWRNLPAMSGELIDANLFGMSDAGNNIGNDGAIILATAYLYKACRHAKLILKPWSDMDWFLHEVGQDRPFIQEVGPEGNMATFVRRLYLGLGVSAAAFSQDHGRDHVSFRSGQQAFEQRRMFRTGSRYLQLADQLFGGDCCGGPPRRWYTQIALQKVMSKRLHEQNGRSPKRSERLVEFTGLQMLTFFKQQRIQDEPGLHFDLISFFTACMKLLWTLRVKWRGEHAALQPEWDHLLVADVLHDGAGAEGAGRSVASSAMGGAAKILENHIATEGSKYVNEAFALSRGEYPVAWAEEASMLARGQVPPAFLVDHDELEITATSNGKSMTEQVDSAAGGDGPETSMRSSRGGNGSENARFQPRVEDGHEEEEL